VEKGGFTAAAKKKVLTNFLAYVDLLIEQNESESCAHLASLLDRPRFEKASLFLLGDANILAAMVDFIQEIAID
jgi:hypothetical protein